MYYSGESPFVGFYKDPQTSIFMQESAPPLDHKAVSKTDTRILRGLAKELAEICQRPEQHSKRELWRRHNDLKGTRPTLLCYLGNLWNELVPKTQLMTEHPLCRAIEWYLLRRLYHWNHLQDDFVFEPHLKIPLFYSFSGWGLDAELVPSTMAGGTHGFIPPIKDPDDISKLTFPRIEIDWERTNSTLQTVREIMADSITVELDGIYVRASLTPTLILLRGLTESMMDMYDRPDWVHKLMSFLCTGTEKLLDSVESQGVLPLNTSDDYVGTGGLGYTSGLPAENFDGDHVRPCDIWGCAETQDVPSISSGIFDEFVLPYYVRLMKRFGLNCFGCCDPLDGKYDLLKSKIPNLRRISVSPFSDVALAAEALEDKYIFSWKPNPSYLAMEAFHPDQIRSDIENTMNIAKECELEIILKGVGTVRNEPQRLTEWIKIAREVSSQ